MEQMSFGQYLQRRLNSEPALGATVAGLDATVFNATTWAEIGRHFKENETDWDYVMEVRGLFTGYAKAVGMIARKRA